MKALILLPVFALLGAARTAPAQFESQILSKIQLNLVNPGGKSLGMGGAFVALADDATAAIANPAGMTQIGKLQLAVSGKAFGFSPQLATSDITFENGQERVRVQGMAGFSESASEVEFASLVAPLTRDLTVALYYAVNLRYRLDTTGRPAGNFRSINVREDGYQTTIDEQGAVNIRNQTGGISIAYRFGTLSAGAGLTLSHLKYDFEGASGSENYMIRVNNTVGSDDPFDRVVEPAVGSGLKAGAVAGMKWDAYEPLRLAIGAVYRAGPRYDIEYTLTTLRKGESPRSYRCGDGSAYGKSACGQFKVPDDFSFGVSLWPLQALAVSLEAQRILYSQLNDSFVPAFTWTGVDPSGQDVAGVARGGAADVWIPRIGTEYTWTAARDVHVYFRAGYHHIPAHSSKMVLYPDANDDRIPDSTVPLQAQPYSRALQIAFEGGEPEDRFSLGLGMSISRTLSFDLAYEYGDFSESFVLSGFYRF